MSFKPTIPVTPFPYFTQFSPTLPNLYWNVESHEELIKRICLNLHKLEEYANYLGDNINIDHGLIEELQEAFQKFIDGGYDEYYQNVISNWINDNFASIISNAIKQVYFGITDDGYFCAYVPDSWSDISFDTGTVYGRSDYGRLILRFDADGQGVINNVYESSYSNAQLNAANKKFGELIDTIITDLESVTRRNDETYDTLYTNLNEVVNHGN